MATTICSGKDYGVGDNYSDDDEYAAAGGNYSDDDGGYDAAGDAAGGGAPLASGASAAAAAAAGQSAADAAVPEVADEFKKRRFLITMRGSLAQLAAGTAATVWTPMTPEASVAMFSTSELRKAVGTSQEKQVAALRRSLVSDIEFYSVHSSFPVDIGVRFIDTAKKDPLDFARGNFFSSTGERFAYVVPANFTKQHSEVDPISVVVPSSALDSVFLKAYGHWTLDNLSAAYSDAPDDPSMVFVRGDAPHIGVINQIYAANGSPMISAATHGSKDVGGRIKMNKATVKKCEQMIISDMRKNLPLVDLTTFGVQFARAEHAPLPTSRTLTAANAAAAQMALWTDPVGLFAAGSPAAARQRIIDQEFSLSIVAGMSFRTMIGGTPDAANATASSGKSSRRSKGDRR